MVLIGSMTLGDLQGRQILILLYLLFIFDVFAYFMNAIPFSKQLFFRDMTLLYNVNICGYARLLLKALPGA